MTSSTFSNKTETLFICQTTLGHTRARLTTVASLPATQDLLARLKSYADEGEDDEHVVLGEDDKDEAEDTNKDINVNDVGRDKDSPSKRASKRLSELAKRTSTKAP